MELESIATRVAAISPGEEEEEVPKKVPEEADVNWGKLKTTYQPMKNGVKDLGRAIKNQDIVDTQRLFEDTIDRLVDMAKATRQREILSKLKNIVNALESE